jgi:hypothetical protein
MQPGCCQCLHGITKAAVAAADNKEEKVMQLMTIFYLATRNEPELRVLFREVSEVLVRSDLDSAQRRNALASLENIATAMHTRSGFKPRSVPSTADQAAEDRVLLKQPDESGPALGYWDSSVLRQKARTS